MGFKFQSKLPCRGCGRRKSTIEIIAWEGGWRLAESSCTRKYGLLFGGMMDCGKAVRNPSIELRREAVTAMVAEASESAIEVLSGAHEDPEYIIRLAAVRALVEIGKVSPKQAVAALFNFAQDGEYGLVRLEARKALLKIEEQGGGVIPLLKPYEEVDPATVSFVYGLAGGDEEVRYLISHLQETYPILPYAKGDREEYDPVYKGLKDMLCRGAGLKVIGDYIAEAPEEQFGKAALLCDMIAKTENLTRGGELEQALLQRLTIRSDYRPVVIRALKTAGTERAALALATLITSARQHQLVEFDALIAIREIGDPIVKDSVLHCFKTGQTENTRAAALQALAVIGDESMTRIIWDRMPQMEKWEKNQALITLFHLSASPQEKRKVLVEVLALMKKGGDFSKEFMESSLPLWDDEIIRIAEETAQAMRVFSDGQRILKLLLSRIRG